MPTNLVIISEFQIVYFAVITPLSNNIPTPMGQESYVMCVCCGRYKKEHRVKTFRNRFAVGEI